MKIHHFKCKYCQSDFIRINRTDRNTYCSRKCFGLDRRGVIFEGMEKGLFKPKEENLNWKGSEVSYHALHSWVCFHRGEPQWCEKCGTTKAKQYDWASKSREYKRDLKDWIRLCPKCHTEYDKGHKRPNGQGIKKTWKGTGN